MAARTKKKTSAKKASAADLSAACRIVVLAGKEASLRSLHTEKLRELLIQEYGEVDTLRFDGDTAPVADVLDECRSVGLMMQHKLVVVDAAEKFVSGDARPLLERYAAAPAEMATLVLRADTWRAGNLDKSIRRHGVILKCDALAEGQAIKWAVGRAAKRLDATLEGEAAELLVARVGTDLGRIDAELGKLASAAGDAPINAALIRELTGATREEEVWGIQTEVLRADAEAGLRAIDQAISVSRHPAAFISFALMDLARKLHAVARLLESGANPFQAAKEAGVWGPSREAVLAAAQQVDPDVLGDLLAEAVDADHRLKSGRAGDRRVLESLAIRFASLPRSRADG